MHLLSQYFVVATTTKFLIYCDFPSKPIYTLVCCLFLSPHTQTTIWDWLQLKSSLCLVSRWFRSSVVHGYTSENLVLSFWGGNLSHTGPTVSKKSERQRKNTFLLASRQHSRPWRCLIPLGRPRTYCQHFFCTSKALSMALCHRGSPFPLGCLFLHSLPNMLGAHRCISSESHLPCRSYESHVSHLAVKRHLIEVRITG